VLADEDTVAVKTTLLEIRTGLADGDSTMVGVIRFKPLPLTATLCVAALALRWLSVTATLALRLPAECGVNITETSHPSPGSREVLDVHRFVSELFSGKSAV
jgi:hypothetical protein